MEYNGERVTRQLKMRNCAKKKKNEENREQNKANMKRNYSLSGLFERHWCHYFSEKFTHVREYYVKKKMVCFRLSTTIIATWYN